MPLHTPVAPALDRRAATTGHVPLHSCGAGAQSRRPFGRVFAFRAPQPTRCPVCDALESLSRTR